MMALHTVFEPARFKYKQVSFENFLFLCCTYTILMIGFALLYLMLEFRGLAVFGGTHLHQENIVERFIQALYFSGVTLFSVGFGDVVPLGIARLLVIIEAMIGYTIPAAFVVRSYIDYKELK